MNVAQSVEWELVGETEVIGEILAQCHVVHHKSHITDLGIPVLFWREGNYEIVYFIHDSRCLELNLYREPGKFKPIVLLSRNKSEQE
jgi:hypothetical protein